MNPFHLSIVIPCFNEEAVIGQTARAVQECVQTELKDLLRKLVLSRARIREIPRILAWQRPDADGANRFNRPQPIVAAFKHFLYALGWLHATDPMTQEQSQVRAY
jgi:hypothetical protein